MVGGSIHQLFEDQVRRAPGHTAVIAGPVRLTYAELDSAAARLAARLAAAGGLPPPGATLAITTDRLPDALVAMLAVLKAGYAYTVIAPGTPRREIARRLGVVRAGAVLTHRELLAGTDDGEGRPTVLLDGEDVGDVDGDVNGEPVATGARTVVTGAGDAATVLFTAGTTGEAKAVTCGHGLLRAAQGAWAGVYGLTPEDRLLTFARPETTEFTGAWIRALCSGATLVLGAGVGVAAGAAACAGVAAGAGAGTGAGVAAGAGTEAEAAARAGEAAGAGRVSAGSADAGSIGAGSASGGSVGGGSIDAGAVGARSVGGESADAGAVGA
ncbi:AMP-binding protein, partial [Streptomyces liangshanensis]|uniref:AMP-binding protein n=1 Tax=Streptomyces liangshanensis TaxID=2717324 RepID=UPI0036DCCCFE